MARQDKKRGISVLEMKLGACLTAPTKRAIVDLHQIGTECNLVRNGIMRYWQRWREDHPNWKPEQRRAKGGLPKIATKITSLDRKKWSIKKINELISSGEAKKDKDNIVFNGTVIGTQADAPVMENLAFSQDLDNEMYARGRKIVPRIASGIVAQLSCEIKNRLLTALPYTHKRETGGNCKERWEAILKYEVAADTFRSIHIPCPSAITVLSYEGHLSFNVTKGIEAEMKKMGGSSCVVRFSLFSNDSGRKEKSHVFRLEARQLPRGKRNILKKVASQEWKMADSKLVFKRNAWYFQLTYRQPQKELNLNKENVATIVVAPAKNKQPFQISTTVTTDAGPRNIKWDLGHSVVLTADVDRLLMRRKVIQNRYSTAGTGRKGHGKERAFRAMKPITRRSNDVIDLFTNNLVAQIIKFCLRYNCGTVVYREPGLTMRTYSWFEEHKIPYNWTKLLNKITHKCFLNGIELHVQRMGCKEHRAMFKENCVIPVDLAHEQIEDV